MVETHCDADVDLDQSSTAGSGNSCIGLIKVKRVGGCDNASHLHSRVRRENGRITRREMRHDP
jgi:hypothetical protein